MGGGTAMPDILGQGGEHEPGPWPRRLAVIGALLLAAVLIAVYLPSHLRGPAEPPPSAANGGHPAGVSEVGGGPDGITGPTQPWGAAVALPVSAEQPSWLWPATGRTRLIGGLPRAGTGYQFTRVSGGWAVQSNLAGNTACSYCNTTPLPVYFLRDQARSATEVGLANLAAPGAAPGELWLTSYSPGAPIPQSGGTAQEFSASGTPLGPQVRLPAGQVIQRATDRGLLLTPAVPRPGTITDTLWDPRSPQANRTFANVIAASPTEIAWAPACSPGGSPDCRVQVLDVVTGGLTTVTLPGASSAASAAFSPDGQFLAVEASFYDGGSLAAQLDVATMGTGRLTAVPESWVSSDALLGFGWPTDGDSLVAELSFTTKVQVASWRPGAAGLAVAAIRPGQESATVVVG